MKRIEFLKAPMDIATMEETVSFIESRIEEKQFLQHVVVNVAKIVNMQKDPVLADSVRACDLINIDGMGVVFGARFLGHDVPERVAGVDLFHELLAMSARRDFPVFLLGATEEIVSKTVEVVKAQNPNLNIAGYHDGYFFGNKEGDDEEAVVNKIRESGAKLLFVAITSPKKENFINKWQDKLGVDFVMGVGGTFDVVAGKVKRAPQWMQNAGLEWFYRILQEPGRMWKRYFITNSKFALYLFKTKFFS
ncbi:WecB/TagA/CpsF family glycosyltransferase [Pseudoalteromonas arctica]|uniref:N-acetylglucosaminyldiphosphoundecaprenol N-acetyl-beta-D-mannosaminyltransferase n=1 Tax=Pseudoalteromonas arctica A 37-1-2 TaxID=1117313 RepID=A0A290S7A4_9GAMM|nr:WecB/TagA/CpsF family glycosyltransferase [Pseudoalteromonas arctica]ATC86891.1 N-acetylglucosaminyldiphosphoundecaprenol N-acetyl-beta-D-mannosaminyltransferase [Pseudoalteromonas arctica A 37-1-2]